MTESCVSYRRTFRGFVPSGRTQAEQNGNSDRIAVLFFLLYDEYRDEAEGLSALPDDDR